MPDHMNYYELDFDDFIQSLFWGDTEKTILKDESTADDWKVRAYGDGTVEYKKDICAGQTLYAWHHNCFEFSSGDARHTKLGTISAHIYVDTETFPEIQKFRMYQGDGSPQHYAVLDVQGEVKKDKVILHSACFFGERVTAVQGFGQVFDHLVRAANGRPVDIKNDAKSLGINRALNHTIFPAPDLN